MLKVLAILFLALSAISGLAQNAVPPLPPWNADTQKAWWAANPTPDTWSKAADMLQAQLTADYQRGSSCFSDPDFQGWMEHLEWLRLGLGDPDLAGNAQDTAAFIALGQDESVSHLLVRKLVPRDDRQAALRNLLVLAEAGMPDLHEYAALGIAYCVVFDEPFPEDWPHPQVPPSAVPVGDPDIVKRFEFYVQANRDKKTELDLTQLSVEDLKYLVDSKVKLSELAYAQQNQIPYDHFDKAFFSINYDESRIGPSEQAFTWPGPTYTLADIEKSGGICVDQAYYACTLGKGRGIPTIYFHGQGTDGGHAWFGYLTKSGKWELDCGRYASQNYPRGYALDPQTWQVVDDTTLANLAKRGTADVDYQPAKNALAWARMNTGAPVYRDAVEKARALMPEFAEPWQDEADYLENSHASLDDKKAFYKAWIDQFQSFIDMRVEGQKRLLGVLKAANDPDADSLQRDIVLQNRDSNFDFGVEGSLGTIEDKFKAQDWDGAKVDFEAAVRDFKDEGGGTFFYNIVRPYMMLCVEYDRMDQADEGIHFLEERMHFDDYGIVGMDYDRLKGRLAMLKVALPAVQQWLGELDDGNYSQAWSDASETMHGQISSDKFVDDMNQQRKPLGKSVSRILVAPPGMGGEMRGSDGSVLKGVFMEERFTDTFDSQAVAEETATFIRDKDGTWRALSYFIKKS